MGFGPKWAAPGRLAAGSGASLRRMKPEVWYLVFDALGANFLFPPLGTSVVACEGAWTRWWSWGRVPGRPALAMAVSDGLRGPGLRGLRVPRTLGLRGLHGLGAGLRDPEPHETEGPRPAHLAALSALRRDVRLRARPGSLRGLYEELAEPGPASWASGCGLESVRIMVEHSGLGFMGCGFAGRRVGDVYLGQRLGGDYAWDPACRVAYVESARAGPPILGCERRVPWLRVGREGGSSGRPLCWAAGPGTCCAKLRERGWLVGVPRAQLGDLVVRALLLCAGTSSRGGSRRTT